MLYSQKSKSVSSATVTPSTLLTSENCESSSRIRTFLRLSRIATDDTIRQQLNETSRADCDDHFNRKIIPQWKARSDVITFCSDYAKQLRQNVKSRKGEAHSDVDLRIDPYAVKDELDRLEEQDSRCAIMENWIRNESYIENIVREQTSSVLNDKCYYKDWLAEFLKMSR